MNCTSQQKRQPPPMELEREAIQFLREHHLLLEPKSRWPQALLPQLQKIGLVELSEGGISKSTIPEHLRPETGAILSAYGDAGWGQEVARGKYQAAEFSRPLVEAVAA